MKARTLITAMLIPAFIGTLTINAQSAHSRNSNDRTRTKTNKQVRGEKNNHQTAYKATERSKHDVHKSREPRQNQNISSKKEYNRGNTRSNHANNTFAYGDATKNRTYRDPKHVSISKNNNPRSSYAKPSNTVYRNEARHYTPAKHNNSNKHKNYNKHYYGGKYYHYAYPTRSVKMNYHYDTYHHHYRTLYYPAHLDVYWTRGMYRNYVKMYPTYNYWHYSYGHRIQTISTFEAMYNMGEVARVYGRVYTTWYNRDTDDFLLFFGGDYPQQNFTIVVPGNVARRYSRRPDKYFLGKHITTTGLITSFEGKPEMVVKQRTQITLY